MMLTLSERDRRTLRLGGIAVGAILLVVFGLFPLMDYWDGLNRRYDDTVKKLRDLENGLQERAAAVVTLRRVKERATLCLTREEVDRQTARLLRQVETLPGYRALDVQRLDGLPLREEDTFYRTGVSIQFAGTLQDLHRLLQAMEEARPALKVERLTLHADEHNPRRIRGQIVVSAYAVWITRNKQGKKT